MRVKQPWMKLGGKVLAQGEPAVITSREFKEINGTQFLITCKVKLTGAKLSTWCKPDQLAEVAEKEVVV